MNYLLMHKNFDPSWETSLVNALETMDQDYLQQLAHQTNWLPGPDNIFNAFNLAKPEVNYILLGESPYPRATSANGYAFWDAAVRTIWSDNGLSKPANRATSLRNFIKMLLVAEGSLSPESVSQPAIAALDKTGYITLLDELFNNMIHKGFLLLNASPVLSDLPVTKEAKFWLPFVQYILRAICSENPKVTILLFGKIAQKLETILAELSCKKLISEHPYNVSFINNSEVIAFFKPLDLLKKVAN